MTPKQAAKKLGKDIETAYYHLAAGKEIKITDIVKVYKEAREAVSLGCSVEAAVGSCVEKYCRPAGGI